MGLQRRERPDATARPDTDREPGRVGDTRTNSAIPLDRRTGRRLDTVMFKCSCAAETEGPDRKVIKVSREVCKAQ